MNKVGCSLVSLKLRMGSPAQLSSQYNNTLFDEAIVDVTNDGRGKLGTLLG